MADKGAEIAAEHNLVRSEHWPVIEEAFKAEHPQCEACTVGDPGADAVQVHHVLPFHFAILLGRPDLELDPRNLISLCEKEKGEDAQDHHLLLGHLDDFQSYNKDVRDFAVKFLSKTHEEIQADALWLAAKLDKPPMWNNMTDTDKTNLRTMMDWWYPAPYVDISNPTGPRLDAIPVDGRAEAPFGATPLTGEPA